MTKSDKPIGHEYFDKPIFFDARGCVKCGSSISAVSRGRGAEPYCNRCGFQNGQRGGHWINCESTNNA